MVADGDPSASSGSVDPPKQLDMVFIDINLQWTSIGTPGKGNVWIGGLPPQTGVSVGFSDGDGVFSGFTEPQGNSLSVDGNLAVGAYGLAYITDSAQNVPQADNVPGADAVLPLWWA
jgi:hypothetical protein